MSLKFSRPRLRTVIAGAAALLVVAGAALLLLLHAQRQPHPSLVTLSAPTDPAWAQPPSARRAIGDDRQGAESTATRPPTLMLPDPPPASGEPAPASEPPFLSTGSFVQYPEGTQGDGPEPAAATLEANRRLEAERRRREAEEARRRAAEEARRHAGEEARRRAAAPARRRALSGAQYLRKRSADSAVGQAGTEPSFELALAGYDEVWVIAKSSPDAKPASPEEPSPVGLQAKRPDGNELPFPLQETRVEARVDGRLQSVLVAQRYGNPYDETIEAVYVFPLPSDAAVSDFVMTVGERRIRGIVREREEAERVYHQARRAGHAASLLTQERPNVFTQRVANIDPGHEIEVELRYFGELARRDGWYELVFPTVVGPRYNPPGSTDGIGAVAVGAHGTSGQRTEQQYLAPGQRTNARFSLSVEMDTGLRIDDLESPSHLIDVENRGKGLRSVALAEREDAANRDFVLRWRVAGEELQAALLRHEDEGASYFSLLLEPPADFADLPRQPMEWVFVLDCSGSMNGKPMAISKRAVTTLLESLRPDDSFQIIRFSSNSSQLGPAPLVATKENVQKGLSHLQRLHGSGGTQMIEGIKAALDFPHDPERYRMVVFLTDGLIGNEEPILSAVHRKLGEARIFSFAVGSAPNRYLLDRLARLGRGAVAWVGPDAEVSEAEVQAFLGRVSRPALTDVELDFGDAAVREAYPTRIPDVFHGRPVAVTGRYEGELGRSVTVRGRVRGRPVEIEVPVDPNATTERPALGKVWARAKIRQLMREGLELGNPLERKPQVLSVALEHGLTSNYTAFVAVDSLTRTTATGGTTVQQPVPVPAGVRYETTVGTSNGG